MDDLEVVLADRLAWEVSGIVRDYRLCIGFHGCRDYMPIAPIRNFERVYQRFVARDQAGCAVKHENIRPGCARSIGLNPNGALHTGELPQRFVKPG